MSSGLSEADSITHFKPQSSICSVLYNNERGTGIICRLEFPKKIYRILLVTSFHVLRITKVSQVTGVRLVFTNRLIGNIDLTPDWIRKLWCSLNNEMSLTIIEFNATAINDLIHNIDFFISAIPQQNEKVTIYDILNDEFNIMTGRLYIIDERIIKINMEKQVINCGAPVFNEEFKVIGIISSALCGGKDMLRHNNIDVHALNIISILDEYKYKLTVGFNQHTKSKEWFAWFNKIPKKELKLIGSGGYANVFKTIEPNGNFLALKIVEGLGNLNDYKDKTDALIKEYELVSSLIHPRIIQFFGLANKKNKLPVFIAMEYFECGSLWDKIKSKGHLDKNCSLKYLIQILEGICFLHQNNIFHSDIKPQNILLTLDDDIKISDFGIAVLNHTNSSKSASNAKGDLHYMAPERLNNEPRSAENDIWCVGATFVTMVTGQRLNHSEGYFKIAQYNIFIDGKPQNDFLQAIDSTDFRKRIIELTLCKPNIRAKADVLLQLCQHLISQPQIKAWPDDGSSTDSNTKAEATVVISSEDSSAFNETTNEGSSSSPEDEDEQKAEAAEKLPTADVNEPSEEANESPANAEFKAVTASTTAGGMPSQKYQSLQSAANGSEWPGAGWPQAPASGRPAEVIIETPTINFQESQQQSTQERAEDWVHPSSPGTSDKPSEGAASVDVVELKCVPSASDLNPPLTSVNNELGVVGTKCAPANMDKTSDAQAEQHSSIEPSETTSGTSTSSDVMNLREQ